MNKIITSPNTIVDKPSQFDSFTVYPELPDGIVIDSANGEISGKPTTFQNEYIRYYTITAKDSTTDETANIPITLSVHSILYLYLHLYLYYE